jgi:hypothetical protein
MWVSGVWMLWPERPPASAPRPSAVDLVLSRARHPSFTPELAEELVSGLSRRRLRRLWSETSRMLGTTMGDAIRLNVVVLRAELLRQLERQDPAAVEACTRSDLRARRDGRS